MQLPTWRDGQSVVPMSAQLMALTNFDDHRNYHPALIAATLAAERDPRFRDTIFKGGCGVKVRNIPGWNAAAAALIHARALLLAHHTVSRRPVYADDTWASVYRAGDYCMPHSHLRSILSVVYMLDPGDQDPADPLAGQLCFADPRIDACCPHEPGRVTQHVLPTMSTGAMLIFAATTSIASILREAAAHHAVVEHYAGSCRGAGEGEDVVARSALLRAMFDIIDASRCPVPLVALERIVNERPTYGPGSKSVAGTRIREILSPEAVRGRRRIAAPFGGAARNCWRCATRKGVRRENCPIFLPRRVAFAKATGCVPRCSPTSRIAASRLPGPSTAR